MRVFVCVCVCVCSHTVTIPVKQGRQGANNAQRSNLCKPIDVPYVRCSLFAGQLVCLVCRPIAVPLCAGQLVCLVCRIMLCLVCWAVGVHYVQTNCCALCAGQLVCLVCAIPCLHTNCCALCAGQLVCLVCRPIAAPRVLAICTSAL